MQTLSLLHLIPLIPSIFAYKPAYNHARQIPQPQIAPRTYNGGWALSLPGTTCPPDASVSCGTNDDTVNPTCCPSGQTCFGLTTPHCCPSSTSPSPLSFSFPFHFIPTWDFQTWMRGADAETNRHGLHIPHLQLPRLRKQHLEPLRPVRQRTRIFLL
jgi:hypothetical protein